jgi:hypothetical protein
MAALAYAKAQLEPFYASHMRDIQRLMGCLVYCKRAAAPPSYTALMAPSRWHDLARDFLKHACSILGHVSTPAAATRVCPRLLAAPDEELLATC